MIWFRGRKNCQRISENRRIKRSRESGFSLTRYLLWCVYFTKDVAQTVLEDTKEVINNSHGTGYAAHRTDIILAGKTGTAEIKASKDDTTGTELGWFSVFTTDENMERPIMIVSMVEDVKGRGGSGYVVKKDSQVLEKWFSGN